MLFDSVFWGFLIQVTGTNISSVFLHLVTLWFQPHQPLHTQIGKFGHFWSISHIHKNQPLMWVKTYLWMRWTFDSKSNINTSNEWVENKWGEVSSLTLFIHIVTLMNSIFKTKHQQKRFWTWAFPHCNH